LIYNDKETKELQWKRPKLQSRSGDKRRDTQRVPESLPISVQKSHFTLTKAERNVLNIGLKKFLPGQSEHILVGGENLLKPALRLMSQNRVRIEEIKGAEMVTSYTGGWNASKRRGAENPEIYSSFSPSFERDWLEAKKRLPEYVSGIRPISDCEANIRFA
jgi:hypothetical protein